ncbi:hypothetical protein GCM10011609_87120 [Lentzea pudingi]|uniref:Uncharacterized protein n=1 Tax=Lentzea pudingi TaxID=1789439 RepID=A0ABQ2IX22_9PSEU|nr:hypothetical protein [Lentzea pudingi]GGN29828.1 hypothetical protein GCM10011609_87120 [Lentzea pudingi]
MEHEVPALQGYGASHQLGRFISQVTPAVSKTLLRQPPLCPTQQTVLINDLSRDVIVPTDQAGNARTCR